MRKIILLTIIFNVFVFGDTTTTYRWPIVGGNNVVISNLGDYRPQSSYGSAHFHAGNDIPAGTADVISLTYTFIVRDYSYYPSQIGWIVRIQHCSDDSSCTWFEGSKYIHMWCVNDTLKKDSLYSGTYISHQTNFWNNHLHIEYKKPEPFDDDDYVNPFLLAALLSVDILKPILKNLYVDYSRHGDADVENLNFLNYKFDTLYGDTMSGGITFKKIRLPVESPDNDLDDPHIIISDNRKVRFVLEGHDNFFSSTDLGAPYELSLFLFDTDSTGVIQKSYYSLRFDSLLGSSNEVRQKEDVYQEDTHFVSGGNHSCG